MSHFVHLVSHLSWLKAQAQHLSHFHNHLHCHPWRTLFDSLLPFTSTCPSLSSSFSFHLLHCELYSELDNLIAMEILCHTANKGSKDAYDVSTSLTGYEPNFMAFSELNDSSGSFSCIIPSSDQDVDDVTLGKLLTEAHRGVADYCEPEGVSVSQSSSSVVFDRAGKPAGERNVDQSVGFGVTRNTYSAHSKFSENTQAEKVVDRTGKPEERDSSNAQIRTLLDEQRQMIIAGVLREIWSSRTPSSSCRRRTPNSKRRIMAASTKSYRNGGITKIPKFYIRYCTEKKAHRGPEHYFVIIRQSTRTTK